MVVWLAYYGGCRKFLLLCGRIGPLALRPCALLRAWGFLPHSINILQIPWWYGDMDWYGMSCARPCVLLRGPAFLMPIMLSKSYLPRRCDWKDGFFLNKSPYVMSWQAQMMKPVHSRKPSSFALAMTEYANQTTMSLQQLNMLRMLRYGRFEDSRVDRAWTKPAVGDSGRCIKPTSSSQWTPKTSSRRMKLQAKDLHAKTGFVTSTVTIRH